MILFVSLFLISSCIEEDSVVDEMHGSPPSDPMMYVVAGNDSAWSPQSKPNNGEPASEAIIPFHLAIDEGQTNPGLYIDDNSQVRYIPKVSGNYYGRSMQANHVYTIGSNITVAHFPGEEGGVPFYDYVSGGGSGEFGMVGNAGPIVLDAIHEGVYVYSSGTIWLIAKINGFVHGRNIQPGHAYAIFGDFTGRGYSGDSGPAQNAKFGIVYDLERDSSGNIYIVDNGNVRIRFVPVTSGTYFGLTLQGGNAYTIIGGGQTQSDEPISLLEIELIEPWSIEVDSEGNLILVDADRERVKFVPIVDGNYYSQDMIANKIYTIAGGGNTQNDGYHGCDGQHSGDYFGDGGIATEADFCHPGHFDIDDYRNIYLADEYNCVIRKIYRNGYIETIAGYRPPSGQETCFFSGEGVPADNTIPWPSGIELYSSDLDGSKFYFGAMADNVPPNFEGGYRIMRSSGRERYCGDGILEGGEVCDYDNWGSVTGCEDFGYDNGTLSCFPMICRFDTSECIGGEPESGCNDGTCDSDETCETCPQDCGDCPPELDCGDGIVDEGEICDETNLTGQTCEGLGFAGGNLACATDCLNFRVSNCFGAPDDPVCNDGAAEGDEDCDGSDLADETCITKGFDLGTLRCNSDCTFDTSGCSFEQNEPVQQEDTLDDPEEEFVEVINIEQPSEPSYKGLLIGVIVVILLTILVVTMIVKTSNKNKVDQNKKIY